MRVAPDAIHPMTIHIFIPMTSHSLMTVKKSIIRTEIVIHTATDLHTRVSA